MVWCLGGAHAAVVREAAVHVVDVRALPPHVEGSEVYVRVAWRQRRAGGKAWWRGAPASASSGGSGDGEGSNATAARRVTCASDGVEFAQTVRETVRGAAHPLEARVALVKKGAEGRPLGSCVLAPCGDNNEVRAVRLGGGMHPTELRLRVEVREADGAAEAAASATGGGRGASSALWRLFSGRSSDETETSQPLSPPAAAAADAENVEIELAADAGASGRPSPRKRKPTRSPRCGDSMSSEGFDTLLAGSGSGAGVEADADAAALAALASAEDSTMDVVIDADDEQLPDAPAEEEEEEEEQLPRQSPASSADDESRRLTSAAGKPTTTRRWFSWTRGTRKRRRNKSRDANELPKEDLPKDDEEQEQEVNGGTSKKAEDALASALAASEREADDVAEAKAKEDAELERVLRETAAIAAGGVPFVVPASPSVSLVGEDASAGATPSRVGSWSALEVTGRDGQAPVRLDGFFASADQRSLGGHGACTVLVVRVAEWLRDNAGRLPTGASARVHVATSAAAEAGYELATASVTEESELDAIVARGVAEWRAALAADAGLRQRFPDGHLDLESALAVAREAGGGMDVDASASFVGFFRPGALAGDACPEWLDSLLASCMPLDAIWDCLETRAGTYVVSWNDHFFTLQARGPGEPAYMIDTLGERLSEGCDRAHVLRFANGVKEVARYLADFVAAAPHAQLAHDLSRAGAEPDCEAALRKLQIEFHAVAARGSPAPCRSIRGALLDAA